MKPLSLGAIIIGSVTLLGACGGKDITIITPIPAPPEVLMQPPLELRPIVPTPEIE